MMDGIEEKGEWSESERGREVKNEQEEEEGVIGVMRKVWQKKCVS